MDLNQALESTRPALEAALEQAERELTELKEREEVLRKLIARARAALGRDDLPTTSERLTLHEAIRRVLLERDGGPMTVHELAAEINTRQLYVKRDHSLVEPNQIHARAKNYASLFEKDGPRISLRPSPGTAG